MTVDGELSISGFKAGGIRGEKYGVALIFCKEKAHCSIMATSNRIKAAPVEISIDNSRDNIAQAVVVTSGNANAFTGIRGKEDAEKICQLVSDQLDIKRSDIIVNSTGIIGQRLQMDEIESHIGNLTRDLRKDDKGIIDAANAMRTTDSFEKIAARQLLVNEQEIKITGFAKGAGMISPDLQHATMIAVILTDAFIPKESISSVLREAVERTFNMINVDGDTSTNDMVVLIANGRAGNDVFDKKIQYGLNEVCLDLAKMIVKDGEGASKLFSIQVRGASRHEDAVKAAKAVVKSTLVKTALFGENPNWGRIIAAIGYSGAEFDPSKLSLKLSDEFDEVILVSKGSGVALKGTDELVRAAKILKSDEVNFTAELGVGDHRAVAYGCDLGYNYVKVNAEYST